MRRLKSWELAMVLFLWFACKAIKNNQDMLIDYHWSYSESISPSSINYSHDAVNDYVKFEIHNKSEKPISFKTTNFIEGSVYATLDYDTLFMALTKGKEKFIILPNERKEVIAQTIRIGTSEIKDSREIIREIFKTGSCLRFQNVEVRLDGNIIELDPIIIPKSDNYTFKIE